MLAACVSSIDNIFQASATFTKWPLLVGPPGSGKAHILLIAQTYALSQCLNTQLVAMSSERARKLGGEHIHLLFGLPVSHGQICTTGELGYDRLNGTRNLVRHMQNLSYTYEEYLICIELGPNISSVICKNLLCSGPSYPSSPVFLYFSRENS